MRVRTGRSSLGYINTLSPTPATARCATQACAAQTTHAARACVVRARRRRSHPLASQRHSAARAHARSLARGWPVCRRNVRAWRLRQPSETTHGPAAGNGKPVTGQQAPQPRQAPAALATRGRAVMPCAAAPADRCQGWCLAPQCRSRAPARCRDG